MKRRRENDFTLGSPPSRPPPFMKACHAKWPGSVGEFDPDAGERDDADADNDMTHEEVLEQQGEDSEHEESEVENAPFSAVHSAKGDRRARKARDDENELEKRTRTRFENRQAG
jgi:hypothetical protein